MRPPRRRAALLGVVALAFGACAMPVETSPEPTFVALGGLSDKDTTSEPWITAEFMTIARARHTATKLNDGEVLVVGGTDDSSSVFETAEIWDPTKDTWRSPLTPMIKGRHSHAAAKLNNGLVLITGGSDDPAGQTQIPDAELYDTNTNELILAPSMSVARRGHTMTVLGDNTALVAGGSLIGAPSSELYVPGQGGGSWMPEAPMMDYHLFHTATLLNDGRVLVVGGPLPDTLVEIYNPLNLSWAAAAPIKIARRSHAAALLVDGRVLVTGGFPFDGGSFSVTDDAEIYDPKADTWTRVSPMQKARSKHAATLLGDNTVLVTGGVDGSFAALAEAEVYDPSNDTWTAVAPMPHTHAAHTATILDNGVVFVAGGFVQATADLYSPRLLPLGSPCKGPGDCMSDFCVDGVCCDTPCQMGACDACSVATGATTDGRCARISDAGACAFDICTRPFDCASGYCSDGVCCESACVGDCRSCATEASPGKCSQAAAGTDPRRACGDGSACSPTCEADGECGAAKPETTVCAARECAPDGASLFEQVTCQPQTGICATLGRAETSCGHYRCDAETAECLTQCNSIRDCATGYSCDRSGACVRPPNVSSSDGGCYLSPASRSHGLPFGAALLLLFILKRRQSYTRAKDLQTGRVRL